jgi:hypothetical protein
MDDKIIERIRSLVARQADDTDSEATLSNSRLILVRTRVQPALDRGLQNRGSRLKGSGVIRT